MAIVVLATVISLFDNLRKRSVPLTKYQEVHVSKIPAAHQLEITGMGKGEGKFSIYDFMSSNICVCFDCSLIYVH